MLVVDVGCLCTMQLFKYSYENTFVFFLGMSVILEVPLVMFFCFVST